jgi:hypothetical protein
MTAATLVQTGTASITEIDESGSLFSSDSVFTLHLNPADVTTEDVIDLVERVSYLEDALEDITAQIRALRPF